METPFGAWLPEVVVIHARDFDDGMAAVLAVRESKTVVLNLSALETDVAQRTADFVAGGVIAMDGHLEQLDAMVFLFAPAIVRVSRRHDDDGDGSDNGPGAAERPAGGDFDDPFR